MSGPVERRLVALPDGPITTSRSYERRGSLPLLRLRESQRTATAAVLVVFVASCQLGRRRYSRPTSADDFVGAEWRRFLQRIDIAHRRIAHSKTHQRYASKPHLC